MNAVAIIILIMTAVLVAVADALIKQAALVGGLAATLKSPLFFVAFVLYLAQLILVAYLFLSKYPLGIIGNTFTVFYAILTVALGYFFFQEKISGIQLVGVLMGIGSVYLMTK